MSVFRMFIHSHTALPFIHFFIFIFFFSLFKSIAPVTKRRGVPLGGHVVHPLSGKHIPVYIANYVVEYGTGAVSSALVFMIK